MNTKEKRAILESLGLIDEKTRFSCHISDEEMAEAKIKMSSTVNQNSSHGLLQVRSTSMDMELPFDLLERWYLNALECEILNIEASWTRYQKMKPKDMEDLDLPENFNGE